ncbi:MAG: replication restart helicase PriA [Janthinobacterium lividum]
MINQRIHVILPLPLGHFYDYLVPDDLSVDHKKINPGAIVDVEFGRQRLKGLVIDLSDEEKLKEKDLALHKLKYIKGVDPDISLSVENIAFLKWASFYTMAPLGAVLKMMLSVPDVFIPLKRMRPVIAPKPPNLYYIERIFEPSQKQALALIQDSMKKASQTVILLDGVTGSGKTEVYLEALYSIFEKGQQALILLPQISLAPQLAQRFQQRYGVSPTLWHSGLTKAQRREHWKHIQKGEATIVIGARSSLFLPYANLGMIVVDEEHDHGYKQEDGVLYQARDLAVARAYLAKIPCLLASATPSLESLNNCQQQKYHHVTLKSRYANATLPVIHLIDMRRKQVPKQEKFWISPLLAQNLEQTVAAGEQALIYLNRRGYAPLTLCGECGTKLECPYCSVWLVHHPRLQKFLCHHCGHSVCTSKTCPSCQAENSFIPCGPGIERIAEEINQRFPSFRLTVISSDIVEDATAMADISDQINQQAVDVIVGTQMITKGHHFPHLTLVGVIDADLGLAGGDLRAREKTYQLLHQVAGRAGREEKPGQVYLQTYYPDHPVLTSLLSGDRDAFLELEMTARLQGHMPPFYRLASFIFTGFDASKVEETAHHFLRHAPQGKDIQVFGPAPAPLAMIRGKYRWRLLLQTPKTMSIQSVITLWLKPIKIPSSVQVKIDIDPYSFL